MKFHPVSGRRILAQRNMHNSHPPGGVGPNPAARYKGGWLDDFMCR
jgi:hypothetical protein